MPAPSTLPEWASAETNNTEPSAGQKSTGWTANQKGISSYMNWWMYLVYLWIVYFKAERDDHETRIATLETDLPALEAVVEAYADQSRPLPLENHPYHAASNISYNTGTGYFSSTSSSWAWYSRESPAWGTRAGETLTGFTIRMAAIGPSGTRTARLYRMRGSSGDITEMESWTFAGSLGSGVEAFAYTLATPLTIGTSDRFIVKIEGADAGDQLRCVTATVDGIP